MSYAVKEIFLTLQGEGAHAGRAAVFCRFAGCNLWKRPRAGSRQCDLQVLRHRFCRNRRHPAAAVMRRPRRLRIPSPRNGPGRRGHRYTVLTGGEPLLQVDDALVDALHARGLCDRRRDQWHDRPARWRGLDLRQPKSRLRLGDPAGSRTQADLPAGRCGAGGLCRSRLRALLAPADGWTGRDRKHRARGRLLSEAIRNGGAQPQNSTRPLVSDRGV